MQLALALARPLDWRLVGWALYIAVNLAVIPFTVAFGPRAPDWTAYTELPRRISEGTVYALDAPVYFAWSPVMAWLMAGVSVIGYWPWLLAHVAAVGVLATRLPFVALLIACSWAFWIDTAMGNTMTFVVVAGALALNGSRPAALVYIALCLLMPRPVQLPLLMWIVWHDRSLIRPAAVLFVIHAALVLGSGMAWNWVNSTLAYAPVGLGPSRYLDWWPIVGLPLAGWLTWKGRVGWAGLAVSPYWLAQYLVWPLIELDRRRPTWRSPDRVGPDAVAARG